MQRQNFSGNVAECMKHLATITAMNKVVNTYIDRRIVSNFIDVSYEYVVRHWFLGKYTPVGENLLKLRYFLELAGYKVQELEPIPEEIKDLGRLVTYRIVSIDDLVTKLMYTNRSHILEMLLFYGAKYPKPERIYMIKKIVDENRLILDQKKKLWESELFVETETSHSVVTQSEVATPINTPLNGNKAKLDELVRLIIAIEPIAKAVVSDDFTPSDRQYLRSQLERGRDDSLFNVKNLLSRLCGERARLNQQ